MQLRALAGVLHIECNDDIRINIFIQMHRRGQTGISLAYWNRDIMQVFCVHVEIEASDLYFIISCALTRTHYVSFPSQL